MTKQRVWSDTAVHQGVTIPAGTTLSFTVDSQNYSVPIPAGTYAGNRNHFIHDLIAPLNTALAETPVRARLGGIHDAKETHRNVIILENSVDDPAKPITNISGNGADILFTAIFITEE